MRLTKLGGLTVLADGTLYQAEAIDTLWQAWGSIAVGTCVGFAGGDTTGTKVMNPVANATADHTAIGIYIGESTQGAATGLGARTTTSGLTGRDAVSGNHILVRSFGVATALVDGTTTDAADINALTPSVATAGELQSLGTTFDAGDYPLFTAIEANTGATAAKKVFVRGM